MSQKNYIEIEIPALPPGSNRTYIHKAGGGVTLTESARRWDSDAALVVGSAAGQFDFEPDLAAEYQIVIRWWGGRHDADAHLKLVQDCVTRKLGFDDRQIRECVIQRCDGPGNLRDGTKQGVRVYLFTCLERDWVSGLILEALGVMGMTVELAKVLEGTIGAI